MRASGSDLIGIDGKPVILRGVNRSGTEYACIQGWGIFDGASGPELANTLETWNVTAVRIPLNESCWLGINGVSSEYGGDNYRSAIKGEVDAFRERGIVAILSLIWAAPGDEQAHGQPEMADLDHSLEFWQSVASTFIPSHS